MRSYPIPNSFAETQCETDIHQLANEARVLTEQFYSFGTSFHSALREEGIKEKIEKLARWSSDYQRGLEAAAKLSEAGESMLSEVRDRLKLAADETTRMEAESPSAHRPKGTQDQARQMLAASKQVEQLIPAVEKAVSPVAHIESPSHIQTKE